MNPREMDDGTLIFPKRGSAPPPLREGYSYNQRDPWIQEPKFPECQLRERIDAKVPCNRSASGFRIITQYTCRAGKRACFSVCTECIGFGEQAELYKRHGLS